MFFLNYIQNFLEGKPMRRTKNESFPFLVGLAVQSSDMSLSSIADVDIILTWSKGINTDREEQIV